MNVDTDHALLCAASLMKEEALVKIFDRYSRGLFRYALRLTGDAVTADHVVGDVFANLLDQLANGSGPRFHLRSYLYKSAYHLIVDEARYIRRRAPLEAASTLWHDDRSLSSRVEERIMLKQIQRALQHDLTDDQRHVILLRYLEEFSLRETAAILGKPIDHIKVIQNRAIAALRRSLQYQEIRKTVSSPRRRGLSSAFGD